MALSHQRISITSTATLISSASAGRDGQSVMIQNPFDSTTVYLGGAGVTASNYGYELLNGSTMSVDLQINEQLYGVVISGSTTVNVIRQGA